MTSPKPLLSENVKDFMDYALEVIQSMDGAPEHNAADQALVNEKLEKLKAYLAAVSLSYNQTVPAVTPPEAENFSGTGHS